MVRQGKVGNIEYTLNRRKGQKTLRLRIGPNGEVRVSAPYYAPFNEVDSFVRKNIGWIEDQRRRKATFSYENGEQIPYLGKMLRLNIQRGKKAQYTIDDEEIVIIVPKQDIEAIRAIIKKIYIQTIKDIMDERVGHWCKALDFQVPSYGVNRAKTKWGVCYPKQDRIYLSYMCATIDEDLVDMTILHELCHLIVPGHTPAFWALMKKHMGDLDERKARLRELGKAGWCSNIV